MITGTVHSAEEGLKEGIPLLGCSAQPFYTFRWILSYTITKKAHHPEVKLRKIVTSLGCLAIPFRCFRQIPRYAIASIIPFAKFKLSKNVSFFCLGVKLGYIFKLARLSGRNQSTDCNKEHRDDLHYS